MTAPRDYRRISLLIHGWWGSGKSWLAATAPGPRLVLDTEGGFYDTPGDLVVWDPNTPVDKAWTKDTSVIVDVQDWAAVETVRGILASGDHPFESVIVDSLHEMQTLLKRAVATPGSKYNPNATFEMQAWGRLLNNMGEFLRELRDLTRPTAAKRVNVVLVSGTNDEVIPAKPLLEGGIRKVVTGFYDVVGYLTEAKDQNQNEVRVLAITPTPLAVAKCRLHNLKVEHGTDIINPDIKRMILTVNPKETK
jgi:hypothetical protein